MQTVLLRQTADVCKVMYAMRLDGDALATPALEEHDKGLRRGLERSLDCALEEHCWHQAKLGRRRAGLGFRCAADLHLAAAVASLTAAVPLAEDVDASFVDAGVFPAGALAAAVEQRRTSALESLTRGLGHDVAESLREAAAKGLEEMRERWQCVREGSPLPAVGRADAEEGPAHEGQFVADAGALDPEHPTMAEPSLQRRLVRVLDFARAESEVVLARAEGRWEDAARLRELSADSTDKTWL